MNLENVNGVGLSYKYINEKNTFEPCLCVLVENKIDNKFLTSKNIIPKIYMGIKTDVIAVGKPSIANDELLKVPFRLRPLEGGCSISQKPISYYGTICCIVKKTTGIGILKKNAYYILSNNHVLANSNKSPIGSLIIQPCYSENGSSPIDVIAILDNFIKVKFIKENNKPINYVDAAIAKIKDISIISNKIYSQGEIQGTFRKLNTKDLLMPVKKVGYKTGLTFGNIQFINVTSSIDFGSNKEAFFKNLIISPVVLV